MMPQNKAVKLLVVFSLLAILCSTSGARASRPEWMTRSGTIGNCSTLSDGSRTYLDAVEVEKIRAKGATLYFTIHECFQATDKIVVLTRPSPELRIGQTIDVEGILTTLPNGCRAIISATVYGYTSKDGKLLRHGPLIKGLLQKTAWPWMVNLTVNSESGPGSVQEGANEPNTTPPPGPIHYTRIRDALYRVRLLADGDLIEAGAEFVCKPIVSTGSGYFIMGEDPPSNDTLKVYYQGGTVTTTQRVCRVIGQLRVEGTGQVLCVDSGPGYNPQDGEGSLTLADEGTIAWAKTFADGHAVTLGTSTVGKIVTCAMSSSSFYIEEDGRSSGIKVVKSNHGRLAGDRAYVEGEMATDANGERYIAATVANHVGDGNLKPVGMNNKWLGGGDFFYESGTGKGQRGITGAYGLNTIGLLVRVWGKVTEKDTGSPPAWFKIDDGSGVYLKVDMNPGSVIPNDVQVNSYVCVTGISSCEVSGNDLVRVLRPGPVVQPTFNPTGGNYCSCQGVKIKSAMLGDIIRYTTNSQTPDENSTVYNPDGVAVIDPTMTLKARVYRESWVTAGSVETQTYTSDCDPSPTCWDYVDLSPPPAIDDLRLAGVAPGMMRLEWNGKSSGCAVQRDNGDWVNTDAMFFEDNFSYTPDTTYHYKVKRRAYTQDHEVLYPDLPQRTYESTYYPVYRWQAAQDYDEITVTPKKLDATANQTVDSRTDTRYVEDHLVDFQFGDGIYRGGLFVGHVPTPDNSKVARSFLKFGLSGVTSGMGTNDRLWTGNLEAYYTRSYDAQTTTNVGCQYVPNDNWDSATLKWSTAPPLNPSAPPESVAVGGTTSSWCHWNSMFGCFAHEAYFDQTLSLGLASKNEQQDGWAYFAKKEFDETHDPHILYAYGSRSESGGAFGAPIFAASLELSSYQVTAGGWVIGTVRLNGPAPSGGINIQIGRNSCYVWVPSPVKVDEGKMSADFVVSTAIGGSGTVTISTATCEAQLVIN